MPRKNKTTRTTTTRESLARVNRDVAHPHSKAWAAHDATRACLDKAHQATLAQREATPVADTDAVFDGAMRDALQAWARHSG